MCHKKKNSLEEVAKKKIAPSLRFPRKRISKKSQKPKTTINSPVTSEKSGHSAQRAIKQSGGQRRPALSRQQCVRLSGNNALIRDKGSARVPTALCSQIRAQLVYWLSRSVLSPRKGQSWGREPVIFGSEGCEISGNLCYSETLGNGQFSSNNCSCSGFP